MQTPHEGRKRRRTRSAADGAWVGYGPQEMDAISGWNFPVKLMTRSKHGRVSARLSDGSRDRVRGPERAADGSLGNTED